MKLLSKKIFVLLLVLSPFLLICQTEGDSNAVVTFDFNGRSLGESSGILKAKSSDANFVEDRFGNAESAIYLNGSVNSYLNLGTSPELKPEVVTISLWVNIARAIYYGKGYRVNPILLIKNRPDDDFNLAYAIFYQLDEGRFNVASTQDSTKVAQVTSVNKVGFNSWYHLVLTSNYDYLSFYINGKLQGKSLKKFETKFLQTDSLMIGNTANKKNERYTAGIFDDIKIFKRVLNEKEIYDLYTADNPNKSSVWISFIFKTLTVLAGIFLIAFLLVWQRRRNLKTAKNRLDNNRKLHEMEIRTLKSQMNPHFIFNSLNSIQEFIMTGQNGKAELYLSKFSKLIRDLLESNANESLTLKEEVEILKGYIEMEMLRFDNSFSYSIEINEHINKNQIKLPHLMIQPFIENAIWHGILARKGAGKITINFDLDTDSTLKCTVDDNGIGRKASQKIENTFKKKSLALSIVKQRLDLMAQSLKVNCSVEIIDKTDETGESAGTKVILILPIIDK